jgi:two-component system response regulator HydG
MPSAVRKAGPALRPLRYTPLLIVFEKEQKMHGSRLILGANDDRLGTAIQANLQKTLGEPAFTCRLDLLRDRLGQAAGGLVLLAAKEPADVDLIRCLVQEICLQNLQLKVVLIEAAPAASNAGLNLLEDHVARRLSWPKEAPVLADLVRETSGQGQAVPVDGQETLEETIDRQLLRNTPSLRGLSEPIALAASHDVPVLVSGETGTGKTYLARLMHQCSPRHKHRFLVISCGALAANLIESEFFGHVKGAFTGADQGKEGKFAAAGDGTILLDEIDTLGLDQQTNLLRVLETGEFEPVGSNQTRVCTARIIAASNWNLDEAVESGKFRRDLYYRLHVMTFHLPPLRERVQDIAPLARSMAARFNTKFRKNLFRINPEAVAALEAFPWPGNIRQLENVVQQAVLVSTGPELLLSHLPPAVQKYSTPNLSSANGHGKLLGQSREELERNLIRSTLAQCRNSRTDTAHALGISRVTLYKKMRKYGLMERMGRIAEAL